MKHLRIQSNFFTSVSEITNLYYKRKFDKYINSKFSILDFGCGSGELLDLIKCRFKIGVEKNNLSLKKVRGKKINCVSKLDDLNNKIKFDTIFALSVLDHLENPIEVIKELKKKLKKNGKLIIIIRQDSFNQNEFNSSYNKHLYSWSPLSFSKILKNANLKIIKYNYLRFTLPPKFNFFKKIFGTRMTILISKMYYWFNFKDRRIIFVCKK